MNGQNEIVPSSIESPNPVEVGQDREEAHVVGANKILCSISMGDSSCVQLITGCYCLVKKQVKQPFISRISFDFFNLYLIDALV